MSQTSGYGQLKSVEYIFKNYPQYIVEDDFNHCAGYAGINGFEAVQKFIEEQQQEFLNKQKGANAVLSMAHP